jgi:hypothetical protein
LGFEGVFAFGFGFALRFVLGEALGFEVDDFGLAGNR